MKRCPVCETEKNLDQFWKGQYLCIPCQKHKQKNSWASRTPKKRFEQHLKYKYGVSHAQFMEEWTLQKGCCAICEEALPDLMAYEDRRRLYAIDHNHETGLFRGILCLNCNTLLGMAKDSARVLQKAIDYLNNKGSYTLYDVNDNMRMARK
jgi:hypothetical protein